MSQFDKEFNDAVEHALTIKHPEKQVAYLIGELVTWIGDGKIVADGEVQRRLGVRNGERLSEGGSQDPDQPGDQQDR